MSTTADALFHSASSMVVAPNYADWTFSLLKPFVAGRVLEVGCGIGTFTRLLLSASGLERITSIDVSPAAVEYCRGRLSDPRLTIAEADVCSVGDTYDLVVCMNVLEHIEDDEAALAHMIELLSPGGTLFLLVPAHAVLFSAFDTASGHHRRYTRATIRALVARIGSARPLSVRDFYFNTIGALGYFVVYRVLRKAPLADAGTEIGWFDRAVVPVLRRIEGNPPFGLSVIAIITKEAADGA